MWFNEKYIMPRETPQCPAAQTLTVFLIKQSCHSSTMTVSLQLAYYDIKLAQTLHFDARLKSLFGLKASSAGSRSNIGAVQGSDSTDKNVNAYES